MNRSFALVAGSAIATMTLAAAGAASAAPPDGTAYADGTSMVSRGTGSGSVSTDADRFGHLDVSAEGTGGTRFLVPVLNLVPYSNPTSARSSAYISDGIDGVEVEAGHVYRVTVSFGDVNVDTAEDGDGTAVASVFGQAANGGDGAGHTLVAGDGTAEVTADGTAVVEFEARPTVDGPIGVVAQVQVSAIANGAGNGASAELTATVTDVEITEID